MSGFFHRLGNVVACGIKGGATGLLVGTVVCWKNCNPNMLTIKVFTIGGVVVGMVYGFFKEYEEFGPHCEYAAGRAFQQQQYVPVVVPTGAPQYRYDHVSNRTVPTNLPQHIVHTKKHVSEE